MGGGFYVFDTEVFPNFFYMLFYDVEAKTFHEFRLRDLDELKRFVQPYTWLIGFNSKNYDSVILRMIVDDKVSTHEEIYNLSCSIVAGNDKNLKKLKFSENPWTDVDLMAIHPSYTRGWGLKKHQARMRWHDIRDLPYPFDKVLSEKEKKDIEAYCRNDVLSTNRLWEDFRDEGILDTAAKISTKGSPALPRSSSIPRKRSFQTYVLKTRATSARSNTSKAFPRKMSLRFAAAGRTLATMARSTGPRNT
jgi:hypothetical protein